MATPTNETKLALMQRDVEYIRKGLEDVKTTVKEGFERIQTNFEEGQKTDHEYFVSRSEFENVKSEVTNLRKGVIFVVGLVITAVVGAILRLVLVQ